MKKSFLICLLFFVWGVFAFPDINGGEAGVYRVSNDAPFTNHKMGERYRFFVGKRFTEAGRSESSHPNRRVQLFQKTARPKPHKAIASFDSNRRNPNNQQDNPYAPFPWPCDETGDCATISQTDSNPYAPFPWPCDEHGDCAIVEIKEAKVYQILKHAPFTNEGAQQSYVITLPDNDRQNSKFSEQNNQQDTPYAPFPWPCDETGDCETILQTDSNPYAPFPWPCDETSDCEITPQQADSNPYAPFPWPCDEHGDCGTILQTDSNPYAPFPWPCDEHGDCETIPQADSNPYAPFPWPCDETGDCGDKHLVDEEFIEQIEVKNLEQEYLHRGKSFYF